MIVTQSIFLGLKNNYMDEEILRHLDKFDLDIRKTRDARFMDQKVTPDVLCIIADCVLQFVGDDIKKEFTTKDIWDSPYANENIKDIFNKPDVLNTKARSEYDKFFAQPLKMLAYAQILECIKNGNRNIFTIKNVELLNYISIKEKNSLNFLILYLEKVLRDSEIWDQFEKFFTANNKDNFNLLKKYYEGFIIQNTPINGETEVRRIFTKVINPLSYSRRLHGTKGGFFSMDVIGYDELMYNRKNWRDVTKLRGETRQEYEIRAKQEVEKTRSAFVKFTIEKAKRLIRLRYNFISEVNDEFSNGQATQVHHIFPRVDFPRIEAYLENLILLTATQHSTEAHPNNNTREINKNFQLVCLLSKSDSIKDSLLKEDGFYSKEDFVFVLNEGIKPANTFSVNKSFEDIETQLSREYHQA